jgi:single-stranded-DNA-specific exonuclease
MIDQLILAMEQAVEQVMKWACKTVNIFHHNDADGLSSGAILTRAFECEGFEVQRFCLEKPYPAVLRKVYQQQGNIFIFADFAGRIAPLLSELNGAQNLTLILDHHVAAASTNPKVHNLDPDLFGLKGDRDISASTTCYLFAKTLNKSNRNLAHIAVIGAVGDGFFVDGRLVSQNREAAMEAVQQGLMEVIETDNGEQYRLTTKQNMVPYDELTAYLDILGAVGYYQDGPSMGIEVCLNGMTEDSDRMVEKLMAIKDNAFAAEITKLEQGALKMTPHLQWIHVANRFAPMGVKMIGVLCHEIRNMDFIDPNKYIAGYQIIPNEIPGFGPIAFDEVKISMRVPADLEQLIKDEKVPPLNTFLPEATNRLGGFSDACHRLAAATTVSIGKEEALINEMEKILNR